MCFRLQALFRQAGPLHKRKGNAMSRLLLTIAAVLALAVAAFGVIRNIQLDTRVQELQSRVSDLEREAEQQVTPATQSEVQELSNQVISILERMMLLEECIPELEDQIYSIQVESGFAFPTTNMSRHCQETLLGAVPLGE
jgi:uncharacterized protein HemX